MQPQLVITINTNTHRPVTSTTTGPFVSRVLITSSISQNVTVDLQGEAAQYITLLFQATAAKVILQEMYFLSGMDTKTF